MNKEMTFYRWLIENSSRFDCVGDFAKYAMREQDKPRGRAGFDAWLNYLKLCRFDVNGYRVASLIAAWSEYVGFTDDAVKALMGNALHKKRSGPP